MTLSITYILHKAFHAVAVRPFQAVLPVLRQRVKNSELVNGCLYIISLLFWFLCFAVFRHCFVYVTSSTMSKRSEAHKSCLNLLWFNLIFILYVFYVLVISVLFSFLSFPFLFKVEGLLFIVREV